MEDTEADLTPEDMSSFQFAALVGDFFLSYTALEHELNCVIYAVVTRFSVKRRDVLLTVLGGQRMAPLKDTIKRLLRATKANQKRTKYIDELFKQLGEIQFFRDRLAHHITVQTDELHIFENLNFAGVREASKIEDIKFELATLAAASGDLQTIRRCCEGMFDHYLKRESSAVPEMPSWEYRPSMLVRHRPVAKAGTGRRRIIHKD